MTAKKRLAPVREFKWDTTAIFAPKFAEKSKPGQGRNRTTAKGQTRPGRRVPTHPFAIAGYARAQEAATRRARGSAIKFHCRGCGVETHSGEARGTLCPLCVALEDVKPDRDLYARITVKLAREREAGRPVRQLLRQTVRVHNRILRRLADSSVEPERAAKAMDDMLTQIKGVKVRVAKQGDLLRELDATVKS